MTRSARSAVARTREDSIAAAPAARPAAAAPRLFPLDRRAPSDASLPAAVPALIGVQ